LDANFLVTYTDSSTDRTFDVLPTFRIIRYEVEVQSELSGFEYEPQIEVRHFVIAPWKEMTSVALAVLSILWIVRRSRRVKAQVELPSAEPRDSNSN
jgi:hypothetical protein